MKDKRQSTLAEATVDKESQKTKKSAETEMINYKYYI
jgi:hypothetical protein